MEKGTVVLTQPHRQQNDAAFAALLNQLRQGILSDDAMAALQACSSRTKPPPTDDIIPTKLYCTNADVVRRTIIAGAWVAFFQECQR